VATSTVYAGLGALLGDPRVSWSLLGDLLPTAVLYDLVLTPFVVWAVLEIARRVEPEPVRW
jgi:rod shape-determining protein MreD